MASFKRLLISLVAAAILVGILTFIVSNYGYVFSVTVDGEIVGVERVMAPVAIVNGSQNLQSTPGMFSFAVAVRDSKGVIHTASSEDRQWAVARASQCVTATFFPYAPWNLKKDGTYYNARLDQLRDCKPAGAATPAPAPTAPPSAAEATPAAQAPTATP